VTIPEVIIPVVQWHMSCFAEDGDEGLIFTGSEGKLLRHSNFRYRVWLPAVRKAGLTGIHFHDLRHTGNTLAEMGRVASDASFRRIRERLLPAAQRAALGQARA
jgi:integrase